VQDIPKYHMKAQKIFNVGYIQIPHKDIGYLSVGYTQIPHESTENI
jgi:hypothetical protein